MFDIDEKVIEYTIQFSRDIGLEVDPESLSNGIRQHMHSARKVVTNDTLCRIGHQHIAVMINTAARYNLALSEILNEAVTTGVQPVSTICKEVRDRKVTVKRTHVKPQLKIVKT